MSFPFRWRGWQGRWAKGRGFAEHEAELAKVSHERRLARAAEEEERPRQVQQMSARQSQLQESLYKARRPMKVARSTIAAFNAALARERQHERLERSRMRRCDIDAAAVCDYRSDGSDDSWEDTQLSAEEEAQNAAYMQRWGRRVAAREVRDDAAAAYSAAQKARYRIELRISMATGSALAALEDAHEAALEEEKPLFLALQTAQMAVNKYDSVEAPVTELLPSVDDVEFSDRYELEEETMSVGSGRSVRSGGGGGGGGGGFDIDIDIDSDVEEFCELGGGGGGDGGGYDSDEVQIFGGKFGGGKLGKLASRAQAFSDEDSEEEESEDEEEEKGEEEKKSKPALSQKLPVRRAKSAAEERDFVISFIEATFGDGNQEVHLVDCPRLRDVRDAGGPNLGPDWKGPRYQQIFNPWAMTNWEFFSNDVNEGLLFGTDFEGEMRTFFNEHPAALRNYIEQIEKKADNQEEYEIHAWDNADGTPHKFKHRLRPFDFLTFIVWLKEPTAFVMRESDDVRVMMFVIAEKKMMHDLPKAIKKGDPRLNTANFYPRDPDLKNCPNFHKAPWERLKEEAVQVLKDGAGKSEEHAALFNRASCIVEKIKSLARCMYCSRNDFCHHNACSGRSFSNLLCAAAPWTVDVSQWGPEQKVAPLTALTRPPKRWDPKAVTNMIKCGAPSPEKGSYVGSHLCRSCYGSRTGASNCTVAARFRGNGRAALVGTSFSPQSPLHGILEEVVCFREESGVLRVIDFATSSAEDLKGKTVVKVFLRRVDPLMQPQRMTRRRAVSCPEEESYSARAAADADFIERRTERVRSSSLVCGAGWAPERTHPVVSPIDYERFTEVATVSSPVPMRSSRMEICRRPVALTSSAAAAAAAAADSSSLPPLAPSQLPPPAPPLRRSGGGRTSRSSSRSSAAEAEYEALKRSSVVSATVTVTADADPSLASVQLWSGKRKVVGGDAIDAMWTSNGFYVSDVTIPGACTNTQQAQKAKKAYMKALKETKEKKKKEAMEARERMQVEQMRVRSAKEGELKKLRSWYAALPLDDELRAYSVEDLIEGRRGLKLGFQTFSKWLAAYENRQRSEIPKMVAQASALRARLTRADPAAAAKMEWGDPDSDGLSVTERGICVSVQGSFFNNCQFSPSRHSFVWDPETMKYSCPLPGDCGGQFAQWLDYIEEVPMARPVSSAGSMWEYVEELRTGGSASTVAMRASDWRSEHGRKLEDFERRAERAERRAAGEDVSLWSLRSPTDNQVRARYRSDEHRRRLEHNKKIADAKLADKRERMASRSSRTTPIPAKVVGELRSFRQRQQSYAEQARRVCAELRPPHRLKLTRNSSHAGSSRRSARPTRPTWRRRRRPRRRPPRCRTSATS